MSGRIYGNITEAIGKTPPHPPEPLWPGGGARGNPREVRVLQPGRERERPHLAGHDRRRGKERPDQARDDPGGTDLGQYRDRPSHGGRTEGLPADPGQCPTP